MAQDKENKDQSIDRARAIIPDSEHGERSIDKGLSLIAPQIPRPARKPEPTDESKDTTEGK